MLTAVAHLGEAAGTVRALNGEAEFADANLQATQTSNSLALTLAGKLGFTWKPAHAQLELQPGLRWQITSDGEHSLQASGRLERPFSIRMDDGVAISDTEFHSRLDRANGGNGKAPYNASGKRRTRPG